MSEVPLNLLTRQERRSPLSALSLSLLNQSFEDLGSGEVRRQHLHPVMLHRQGALQGYLTQLKAYLGLCRA
jgi:hypothetical protein